jgi:hypothetical protein
MKASTTMSSVEAFASMESPGESAVVGMARAAVNAVIDVIIVVSFMEPPIAKMMKVSIIKAMVEVAEEYDRRESHVKR